MRCYVPQSFLFIWYLLIMLMLAGVTPAERLLELYDGKWNQSVDHVFEELLY